MSQKLSRISHQEMQLDWPGSGWYVPPAQPLCCVPPGQRWAVGHSKQALKTQAISQKRP